MDFSRSGKLCVGAALIGAAAFVAAIAASPLRAKDYPSPMQEAQAKKRKEIKIGYLQQQVRRAPPASRLDDEPDDIGIAGAETALRENNAAGQFTGFLYSISEETVAPDGDAVAAMQKLIDGGSSFIVVDAPAKTLLALSDAAKGKDVLLFNIRAEDTSLRQEDCRANIMHVAPDRTMLADGLGQYLIAKGWKNWLLVRGETGDDKALAAAIQRAADRFGARIVETRIYRDVPGRDRDEIGVIPPAAADASESGKSAADGKSAPPYDIAVLADEERQWSVFAPYRGGTTRPVAGSAGLMPVTWSAAHAKWGARQLNTHFEDEHHRRMLPVDFQGYVAARTVGEAVTRNMGADFAKMAAFIHSDKFQLNAFKGIRQTYRPWDGQFRDPVLIATGDIVVSVSPQPGFPHPTEPDQLIDTLGIDKEDSACKM